MMLYVHLYFTTLQYQVADAQAVRYSKLLTILERPT